MPRNHRRGVIELRLMQYRIGRSGSWRVGCSSTSFGRACTPAVWAWTRRVERSTNFASMPCAPRRNLGPPRVRSCRRRKPVMGTRPGFTCSMDPSSPSSLPTCRPPVDLRRRGRDRRGGARREEAQPSRHRVSRLHQDQSKNGREPVVLELRQLGHGEGRQ